MEYIYAAIKYLNAWLLLAAVLIASVVSEKLYIIGVVLVSRRPLPEVGVPFMRNMRAAVRTEVGLPENAWVNLALYTPALAFAALMTVCASVPFSTFIPIIDNGSDIIQLIQFMLLSEVLALVSLYALGTQQADSAIRAEMAGFLRLFLPVMACCASIATFLIKNGLDADPFSLNSFSIAGQLTSMSKWGLSGLVLFVFIILSQIPHRDYFSGCALIKSDEIPEFRGAPRSLLQIWAVFRSFIIIALITYILSPTDFMTISGGGIWWGGQALNFVVFWLVVMLMRIAGAPLCWFISDMIRSKLPKPLRGMFFVAVITICAMLLLYYEGILLSQEAAAF